MTLYAIPFACSFSAHLALRAWDLDHDLVWVDRGTRLAADGARLPDLNPKDLVSTLVTPDRTITENAAVLLHLATQAGRVTSLEDAVRHVEALSFIATELHKGVLASVYRTQTETAVRERLIATPLPWGLSIADGMLDGRDWLVGDAIGPADFYLFWVLALTQNLGVDLARWPNLAAFQARIMAERWARAAFAVEQAEYVKAPRSIARAAG